MVRKLGRPTIACAAMMVAGCFTDVPSTSTTADASTTADVSTTAASATTAADLGGSAGEPCTPGSVTCPCYGNGTCDAGLSCQTGLQLCVPTGCLPGENRCVCDGGSCAASQLCIDGLCQARSEATGDGTSSSGSPTTTGTTSSPSPLTTGGVVCPTEVVTAEGECARIVFLSKDPVPGGGFDLPPGAAVRCNSDAKGAGLPGTYAALLWTTGATSQSGDERVGLVTNDPYVFVLPAANALVPIAMNAGALTFGGGGPTVPINVHADGTVFSPMDGCAAENFVWTGAIGVGGMSINCGNWSLSNQVATAGNPAATDSDWLDACRDSPCGEAGRFYCFQLVPA